MNDTELEQYILDKAIPCPICGKSNFTNVRKFNLMFKTFVGPSESSADVVYLRPETAQGIFVNFANLLRANRNKMPFGVGQIGKSFRNEITPGNFIFRTREFEQMELEFFCKPGTDIQWFGYWRDFCAHWLQDLGIKQDNMRIRDHLKDELGHYSTATCDIEYHFPFGWGELWGISDRTDYDLKAHSQKPGDMDFVDNVTKERYMPYVIEPSLGVDRMLLAFLCNAYEEQKLDNDTRIVLHLHHALAPYKVAILPLQKDEQLQALAQSVYTTLNAHWAVTYDETASIGKRYRRQDEIGTPYCVTVDFDTPKDHAVTIRERDSMQQVRVQIDQLVGLLVGKLAY
jgi:glycyl-tRNA synthetase